MPFTHFYSNSLAQELALTAVRREAATAAGAAVMTPSLRHGYRLLTIYYYFAGSRSGARCAAVRREATAAARRVAVLTPSLHRTWVPFTRFYSNSLAQELAHAPRCGARLLQQPRAAALTPSLHRGYQSPTATAAVLASMLARAAVQRQASASAESRGVTTATPTWKLVIVSTQTHLAGLCASARRG